MKKTAIVTGASRGIGRATALRLAQDGFAVAANYLSNAAEAGKVVAAIQKAGGAAVAVQGDVAEASDVERLFAEAAKEFGSVDVVVHNSGILLNSPIAAGDVDGFDRIIRTNLRGTFLVLSQAAKQVRQGGRIIALSTTVVATALPTYGAYAASKAGVEALVRTLSKEMRGRQVTVNAVAPGATTTEMFLEGKSEELLAQLKKAGPMERFGEPDEIARAVSFLAGPDGAWVNGQVLRVNGGTA
jgi:3-oxoacyl-[acyl-carrier protein] reductase